MKVTIPENKKIAPFLVFFTIHAMQTGIGILGFTRIIARHAGYDSWMSIILVGIIIHILMWMIYKMTAIADGDIIAVHTYIFGKKLSKMICSIFILYFCLLIVTVLRGFIEIVHVWMFPDLSIFWFSLTFFILAIYIVNGGIRTITGIAFFSVVLPFYIVITFLLTLPYASFTNLLPMFDHSLTEVLHSTRSMSLTVIGFETLLFFYPFIKSPEKSRKWAFFSNIYTTLLNLYVAIFIFAYFSENQLQKYTWPLLTIWKVIKMPFVERFEYIGIANWCLIILPNICLALWCASRLIKQIFSIRQKTSVPALAIVCLVTISLIVTGETQNMLSDLTGKIGFYINFFYLPFLFFATLLARKVKKRETPS
ncbi:GerAB/ArcD/ProY family transporter [Niallia endozanthoxylica]|uniref:GerAB/ArcD/ProY family transporter n=1 Tax=Niallia endozanthoxylica TaxID=2036016 RepID=A0A5J5HE96_9BACI|nr:GerAB/ArcD/ProY family transporter [Niallia endozanthoxylica]KAA9017973.1 GerAB/ArcD/ProY family transporter [Niallia endozanthoxylica]